MHRVRAGKLVVPAVAPLDAPASGTWVGALEHVRVSTRSVTVNGALRLETVLAWDAQPGAIEYVARIERLDGSEPPSERRTTSTFVSAPALQALYRYRAAACNRVGCSLYRAAP